MAAETKTDQETLMGLRSQVILLHHFPHIKLGRQVSINPNAYHCYKRTRQSRYLPQEMFFQILSCLPARVLHDVTRYVCREWNLMIHNQNFIHHHLRNSTGGILIQNCFSPQNVIYVEIRRGSLEICKLDCGSTNLLWTSCNGLVLVPDSKDPRNLCVMNPLTKQGAVLHPYSPMEQDYLYFALGFAEASMDYKAVCVCRDENSGLMRRIAVLTIGVDRVPRLFDVQHLILPAEKLFAGLPLVTKGYVHWLGETFVLTLNLETEVVCRFSMPRSPQRHPYFLPMGSTLSHMVKSNEFFRDVWEMNPQTGEWSRTLGIDLKPVRDRFKELICQDIEVIIPVGWLKIREVLVLRARHRRMHCILAFNVRTREVQLIEMNSDKNIWNCLAHVNSLVDLGGIISR